MRCVSHKQASQLLHNKFIVVLGDSIQRSVYKDLVLLLQREKHLTHEQLRSKGEMSFEQDCLVEGGCLSQMHNGTQYREVRQFRSDHHLVRFYFVTRVYSDYMQSILEDFRHGLKPDVVIVNSCVWDISRYSGWMETYKENLQKFFIELKETLPEETLVVWSLTMPLGEKIKGGFLVSEHKAPQLRNDVIEANFYSGTLGDFYGMDVLDLHFQFRFSLQHRTKDGVHWNALAHRRITFLLLQHIAEAWGVFMPSQLNAGEEENCDDFQNENRLLFFIFFYLLRRCSSRAPVVHSQLRPPPRIDFSQRNKHNMQRLGFVASDLEQTTVRCKVCSKAYATKGSGPNHFFQHLKQTHASQWDTCCSLQDVQTAAAHKHPLKASEESFNHCVPYEKKGSWWTAVTDADAASIYSGNAGGSSTCRKCSTSGLCCEATTGPQARGSRQARLPGQKFIKSTNMSCLLCNACRCLI
uniref:Family with sequence similarity 113 n=1 Tax=Sparus aurata TaxID=8175 RepID=A0A671VSC7_SPAAU